jgi:hypothetical protein
MGLTERDRDLLAFEGAWWSREGTKAAGIRRLGLSPTAYYRRLAVLLDDPEALAVAPLVVHRLRRRRRDRRREQVMGPARQDGWGR